VVVNGVQKFSLFVVPPTVEIAAVFDICCGKSFFSDICCGSLKIIGDFTEN
jgi:hypothetical protein